MLPGTLSLPSFMVTADLGGSGAGAGSRSGLGRRSGAGARPEAREARAGAEAAAVRLRVPEPS